MRRRNRCGVVGGPAAGHGEAMAAHFQHLYGETDDATVDGVRALLAELENADDEHPDVAVGHESGWTLSVFRDGFVVWEDVENEGDPRHLDGLAEAEVLRLMEVAVRDDLATVHALAWRPGYGT